MELLDNTTEDRGPLTERGLKRIYSVLLVIGLIYGFLLFARYFMIAQQFDNPLLPDYTTSFIYGNQAFAGMLLSGGMSLSYVVKLFHTKAGLIILLLTLGLIPFSDIIYALI